MNRYFDALVGGFLIALILAVGPLLHRWRTRWNATADEVKESLPGDEIVKAPTWTYTHAIRIRAPRAAVWPWLVQIGQGRGGFFSYEVLENLAGAFSRSRRPARHQRLASHMGASIFIRLKMGGWWGDAAHRARASCRWQGDPGKAGIWTLSDRSRWLCNESQDVYRSSKFALNDAPLAKATVMV